MSGSTSKKGTPQCLALNRPAGSYRHVDDRTAFAPVRSTNRTKRFSRRGSTMYGSLRGFGVRLQLSTPSMSKKMTCMTCVLYFGARGLGLNRSSVSEQGRGGLTGPQVGEVIL